MRFLKINAVTNFNENTTKTHIDNIQFRHCMSYDLPTVIKSKAVNYKQILPGLPLNSNTITQETNSN